MEISLFLWGKSELKALVQQTSKDDINKPLVFTNGTKTSLLVLAIKFDKDLVSSLLEKGANPNGTPDNSPLLTAAVFKKWDIVRLLLTKGANPSVLVTAVVYTNVESQVPLFYKALEASDSPLIDILLDFEPELIVSDYMKSWPEPSYLHLALKNDLSLRVIRYLLTQSESLNRYKTLKPYEMAYEYFLFHVARYPADPDNKKLIANRQAIFNFFLDHHVKLMPASRGDEYCYDPLYVVRSDLKTLNRLLEKGFDPNNASCQQKTHLSIAAERGDIAIFKALLKAGGVIKNDTLQAMIGSDKKSNALILWVWQNKTDIFQQCEADDCRQYMEFFLNRYEVDDEFSPIIKSLLASLSGNNEVLNQLLSLAVDEYHMAVAENFIAAGADADKAFQISAKRRENDQRNKEEAIKEPIVLYLFADRVVSDEEKLVTFTKINIQRPHSVETSKPEKNIPLPIDIEQLKDVLKDYHYYSDTNQKKLKGWLFSHKDLSELNTNIEIGNIVQMAIEQEHIDTLQLLIDKKLNLKKTADAIDGVIDGTFIVQISEEEEDQGHWPIVQLLVEKGGFSANDFNPLIAAIKQDNVDIVRWLVVEQKVPVQAEHYKYISPLMLALQAKEKQPTLIRLLLEQGANPNYKNKGNTATSMALATGNDAIIALFEKHVSKDSFSVRTLNDAIRQGNIPLAKRIIDFGININQKWASAYPLYVAIQENYGSESQRVLVKYLIDKGANVNPSDSLYFDSALADMMTNTSGTELIRYAIDHGAKLDFRSNYGTNLFGFAFYEQGFDKIPFLIELGLPLTEKIGIKEGLPLHAAFQHKGQEHLITMIMDKMKANHEQAYFNTPDYLKGNTALHYAVQLDHEAIVTELLKEGGDIQLKNNFREGKLQPIAYAKNEKMLTLLQGSNDDHSINSGYCTTYVENSGDNSKQHHCLKSADYFLQKKYNVQGALFHYLLAGKTAKVIDLSKNNKFISNCYVCDGGYIDIAHAYLLQDNKRKAHEYYKMAFNVDDRSSDQQEYWQKEINDKVMNKIAIMEKLHMGFTEKATALWQEVLDQQVSD